MTAKYGTPYFLTTLTAIWNQAMYEACAVDYVLDLKSYEKNLEDILEVEKVQVPLGLLQSICHVSHI